MILSACFLIIFAIGYLRLFETQPVDKRSIETLADIGSHTAILNRVINAIFLQNALKNGSIFMNDVIADTFGVPNGSLFDSIDEVSVRRPINLIKTMDLLSNQSTITLDEAMHTLNGRAMGNGSTVSFAEIEGFNSSTLHTEITSIATIINDMQRDLMELTSPKSNMTADKANELIRALVAFPNSFRQLKIFHGEVAAVGDSLYRLRLFLLEMECLNTSFKSLEPSVTLLGSWLNSSNNKATKTQLDAFNNLFSPINSVFSPSQVLIGLPNKSKDLEMLAKDFENKWLKEMLNKGFSLDELKVALLPVCNISSELASVEEGWTKPKKMLYFEIVQQTLMTIRNVDKLNPKRLFKSFSRAKANFTQLDPADKFGASETDKLKNLINSTTALEDVRNDLSFLLNSIFTDFNETEIGFLYSSLLALKDKDKVERLRNSPLTNKYRQMFDSANVKIQELESKLDKFRDFHSAVLKFKPFVDGVIDVSTSIDSMIKAVANYVNVLKLFSPYTADQLKEIEQLGAILLLAREKLVKSLILDLDLKKDVRNADGANRLKNFSLAREITFQLAFSHKTLALYQRPDLHQLINNFVNNGTKLAQKIETLSAIEKQSIGSGWNNFLSIGPLMVTLSSEIKTLTSSISNERVDFKSFGTSLSILDKVKVPSLDFAMMFSTLDDLKSTDIGQSPEIVDTENCLQQLLDLQYAAMRRNGTLLITDAQVFFKQFFEKPSDSDSDSDRLWLCILLVFVTVIILCIIVFFFWRNKIHCRSCKSKCKKGDSKVNDVPKCRKNMPSEQKVKKEKEKEPQPPRMPGSAIGLH
uniref:WSN domain-containing protein n=1 Tax=Caenorhabditis japonica TaxID=281687 RepID=A0A8R1DWS7_CAEJA